MSGVPTGSLGAPAQPEGEKRPLLSPFASLTCYSTEPHCTIEKTAEFQHITKYNLQKLTTVRVFLVTTGTVLTNVIIWVETLMNALVFWMVYTLVMTFHWDGLARFVGKESNIRSFIAMFTTFVGLLLSFYTSLNIKRWWDMRMLGVGGIWQTCSKLTLQISQGVTRDPEVLHAIWRYSSASLVFIFMQRRGIEDRIDDVFKLKLLTEAECQQMSRIPASNRSEAIWSWLGAMVSQLNAQGLVAGPPHYAGLMNTIDNGRGGSNVINSYLETPIPMAYVHILGLMVKLHNIMVAMLMGILSAKHMSGGDYLGAFRTMFRAFFMSFLYNALLLINDDISDPFGGDISDLPMEKILAEIKDDAESIIACGSADNLPAWLVQGKKFKKWVPVEESTV
eukprot:TRINITY_DN1869_c0_g3_i2.p1 TRINITY_DN1869_c0_g3~~TRINITY_DN1869_c0_g3_i2.p1  ORF type:complete len:394 (-),score=64.39 TRINITY_DN1869_c0_g3_i2:106-1287(-)